MRIYDITPEFFDNSEHAEIPYTSDISVTSDEREDQFSDYTRLNLAGVSPFIETFFKPSSRILHRKMGLIDAYGINCNNCIGVYYRGTDKYKETVLGDFELYKRKIETLVGSDSQLLIQTDSHDFMVYMREMFPNCIQITENATSRNAIGIHKENDGKTNYHAITNLFATFLILSDCKHLVVSSGNGSLWMMYYRKKMDGVYQCLNNRFL